MRGLRIVLFPLLVNACVLCGIIVDSDGAPSTGLVAWAVVGGVACFVTQVAAFADAIFED